MSGDADIGIDDGNDINKSTLTRPSSPPPRAEAFETFKNGRGKELHAVFLQNKGKCVMDQQTTHRNFKQTT